MTKIEEMLAEHCPNGVEWKELGEVCELKNGYTPSKAKVEFWKNGSVPWFRLEDIRKNGRVLSDAIQHVTDAAIKNGKIFPAKSVIVSTTATIGEVALIMVPFLCNQQITAVIPKALYKKTLDIKFLFYYMQILSDDMKKGVSEGSFPIISLSKMKTFQIPLPPLKIQEEIVQILDKFTKYVTELTAELTAELTFRKQQYSYCRDKLLSFEDDVYQVEWKTLGEVGKVSMCKRILKNQTSEVGEIPFYKIGTFGKEATAYISRELFENYKEKFSYPKLGDILISASGTIGRTVVFNGEDSYFQDSNIVWLEHDESQVLNRYLFYFYQMNPWQVSNGGTISRLYNGNIEKTKIPLPPLHIQSRIVQVLDNFDTVCNDLKIGLPKEIALRQKQYEFFREKLLTFTAEGVYAESRVE
ncbi:restriction endonuclease subunit S [Streptococcus azizii]|uniref:restriction endonuclease subunit S n=1 Tax=Streptococcus azizii TaxID=1579424 RepID=UPI00097BD348|nr:restriction endonuclease subunit S [Streptococcus azizii]ONK29336.1 restriction endonuclease subunit S [Streptococcus azizii]